MTLRSWLPLCGLVLALLGACRSSSLPQLTVELEPQGGADTLALVTYLGDKQYTDSLRHYEAKLRLYPDTARYHRVLIQHAGGTVLRYFELRGDQWQEAKPQTAAIVKRPSRAEDFSGLDIDGRQQTLTELYKRHQVQLVFASPEGGRILTPSEQRRLIAAARPDSLTFVFLLPTLSSREARQQLRRDSLRGIAFSDSLGLVTELRQRYGVVGEAGVKQFRIDTLGQVK